MYTKDELEKVKYNDLLKILKRLGIKCARQKAAKVIELILEAQENTETHNNKVGGEENAWANEDEDPTDNVIEDQTPKSSEKNDKQRLSNNNSLNGGKQASPRSTEKSLQDQNKTIDNAKNTENLGVKSPSGKSPENCKPSNARKRSLNRSNTFTISPSKRRHSDTNRTSNSKEKNNWDLKCDEFQTVDDIELLENVSNPNTSLIYSPPQPQSPFPSKKISRRSLRGQLLEVRASQAFYSGFSSRLSSSKRVIPTPAAPAPPKRSPQSSPKSPNSTISNSSSALNSPQSPKGSTSPKSPKISPSLTSPKTSTSDVSKISTSPKSLIAASDPSKRSPTYSKSLKSPSSTRSLKRPASPNDSCEPASKIPAIKKTKINRPEENYSEKKTNNSKTAIPRFVSYARSIKIPNFAKIHEKQFKKMEALDDYVERKQIRAISVKKTKVVNSTFHFGSQVKDKSNVSSVVTPEKKSVQTRSSPLQSGAKANHSVASMTKRNSFLSAAKAINFAPSLPVSGSRSNVKNKMPPTDAIDSKNSLSSRRLPRLIKENVPPRKGSFGSSNKKQSGSFVVRSPSSNRLVAKEAPKSGQSRFGWSAANKITERKEKLKKMAQHQPNVKNSAERRTYQKSFIKGVRSNRRFQLQMANRGIDIS